MKVNEETVLHLAALSDFALSENEARELQDDLRKIIEYISQLDELDTAEIEPTYQVTGLRNVWRADEIQPQAANTEELLALTKNVEKQQIKVPKVL